MNGEQATLASGNRHGQGMGEWSFAAPRVTPATIAAALSHIVAHTRPSSTGGPVPGEAAELPVRQLLESLPVPVYAVNAQGWVTYYNQAAVRFAGRTPVIGRDRWCIASSLHAADGTAIAHGEGPMVACVRQGITVQGVEMIAERPDGTRVPFWAHPTPIRDEAGLLVGAVNVMIDITERKQAQAAMEHLACHDALTGLANRASFSDHLATLLEERAANRSPFAVMKLDILGFRHINDRLGHAAGDEVLRKIGARLRSVDCRMFLARIGADKFAVVMASPGGRDELRGLATRLRAAVDPAASAEIRIAVGCAVYPVDGDDERTLVAHAASALYRAKQQGGEAIVFYDAEADLAQRERRVLQTELRRAIDAGELRLDYQPQTARDGSVSAFEALVRWRHPERGVIPPGNFIPMAEEDGTIVPMSEWILREACREAATWPGGQRVSVNISPIHFRRGDLPELVAGILAETGLEPGRLELEITEGVMVDDFDKAMCILQDLRALGLRIALDDFGTGYSSLSYLQAFPFSKLKIDRSFTENLGRVEKSAAIIRSIVGLGHALELEVAAEGIESQEQLDFLLAEGCDLIQGYFTGRPANIATYAHLTGVGQPALREERGLRKA
jgi:diguanylate cyclase (GGDEF)-like protein/PAS domain S-box-containing protein